MLCLEGIYFGYKLMNYLQKRQNYDFSSFTLFFFKLIPKLIMFYFLFFLLHYGFNDFGISHGNSYFFQYFLKTKVLERKCIQNIYSIFIPFYYNYVDCDSVEEMKGYKLCFNFFYYYSCELYCFLFSLIIIYIGFKLKSVLFDSIFAIVIVINFILLFLWFPSYSEIAELDKHQSGGYLGIDFIFGEKYSIKKPHIAYFDYFIGMNVGIMYYYYLDVVKSRIYKDTYRLFSFNYRIMKCLGNLKYKKTLICFLGLLITLCSFSFYILVQTNPNNMSLQLESTPLVFYFYIYEKKIVVILFAFICLLLLLLTHDHITKKVIGFGIFSRVSFIYIVVIDFSIYLFFSFFSISIFIEYQNLFFFTIAMVVIVFFFSIITSILYYFPLILLYKFIMRWLMKSKVKDEDEFKDLCIRKT